MASFPLKLFLLATSLINLPLVADNIPHSPEISHEDEALLAQRILDLHRDHELEMAIHEAHTFSDLYPSSHLLEGVNAILAESYFQNTQYLEATRLFRTIKNKKLLHSTFSSRVRSLLRLCYYRTLFNEMRLSLPAVEVELLSEEDQFFVFSYATALLDERYYAKSDKQKQHLESIAEKRLLQLLKSIDDFNIRYTLANLYKEQNKFHQAVEQYKLLANQNTENKEMLLLELAHLQAKIPSEGINDSIITTPPPEKDPITVLEESLSNKELSSEEVIRNLFALSRLYEKKGDYQKAKNLYKELLAKVGIPKSMNLLAQLRYSEALLANKNNDPLDGAEQKKALDTLKRIAAQKQLKTEPIHLEAAIAYARYKSATYPSEQQNEKLLNFLKEYKEDFTATEDLNSKDYHASRLLFPHLDKIYKAYMLLIDTEIASLEAKTPTYTH